MLTVHDVIFCVSLIPSQTEAGIGEEGGREQLPPPYGMEDNFALDYSDGFEGLRTSVIFCRLDLSLRE